MDLLKATLFAALVFALFAIVMVVGRSGGVAFAFLVLAGIASLVANILATIEIIQSDKGTLSKVFWIILMWAVLGVLATIAYYLFARVRR